MAKKTQQQKLEELNEKIKARNIAFEKMSPAQKRVAIAEDVIASLRAKKYTADSGTYCDIYIKEDIESAPVKRGAKVELQEILLSDKIEACNVCAIGSMFASRVAVGDSFKVNAANCKSGGYLDLNNSSQLIKTLDGIFTTEELRYIEYAFEGQDIKHKFNKKPEEFHAKVDKFYYKYEDDDNKRLTVIMKNIIKNEGTFKL